MEVVVLGMSGEVEDCATLRKYDEVRETRLSRAP